MKIEVMKLYGFLGIGAFGGNITRPFEDAGFPCVVVNSSTEDLEQVKCAKYKYHLTGGSGCHKDRRKSKSLLKSNLESLITKINNVMPNITTLFICASAAGGTGSGMLAATAEILKNELGINICVVTVLPNKSEQFKAQANTVELFKELEEIRHDIGAIFILDNSRHTDKMRINEVFFQHLSALLANENGSERGCVDRGEIDELLRTPGMAVLSVLKRKSSSTHKLLNSLKENSVYAPIEEDKVIRYFCLIGSGISIKEIKSSLGEPVDAYIGTNSDYTIFAAVGLSFPKARLTEIIQVAQSNAEKIKRNTDMSKNSIFGDSLDFLGAFDIVPSQNTKPEKKISSLDTLNKYL